MTTTQTAVPISSRIVSAAPVASPDEFACAVAAITGEALRIDEMKGFVGRNDNWLLPTDSGRDLFVKCLRGTASDVESRINRVLAFEEIVTDTQPEHFKAVPFRGADRGLAMLVFDYLPDSQASSELFQDGTLDAGRVNRFGKIIGEIHSLPKVTISVDDALDAKSANSFYALTADVYANCSGGEVEAWAMLQHDKVFVQALARLRSMSDDAPVLASHSDMRLDQFLLAGNDTYVIDWEEFRYADPARDVGGIVGEFLHHAAMKMFSELDIEGDLPAGAAHEAILAHGQEELDKVSEHVTAFWDGYRSVVDIDEALPVRATGYAGWFFFDRLLAGALHGAKLSAAERGMAGIGRNALTQPEHFAPTIGLTKKD